VKHLTAGAIIIGLVAAIGAGWWFTRSQPTTPAPPSNSSAPATEAPPFALSGRLLLEPAGPGLPTLGIVRLFDARARNGFSPGGASVDVSRLAIERGVTLEIEQAGGNASQGVTPLVVRASQDGPQRIQADTTIEIWVDLPTLPTAGSRVRVSLPIGGAAVVTDWVEVPAGPTATLEQLFATARVQRAKGDQALAATAEQMITAAPTDARGYYYRGLAREASGDRVGAIAAYEAALQRVPTADQEPPAALYRRLARLRGAR